MKVIMQTLTHIYPYFLYNIRKTYVLSTGQGGKQLYLYPSILSLQSYGRYNLFLLLPSTSLMNAGSLVARARARTLFPSEFTAYIYLPFVVLIAL